MNLKKEKKYDVPKKADISKMQTKKKIQKSDPYFEMETEDISVSYIFFLLKI